MSADLLKIDVGVYILS